MNADQIKITEEAGVVAFMSLEKIPSGIRAVGVVSRIADSSSISIMVKVRSRYFV